MKAWFFGLAILCFGFRPAHALLAFESGNDLYALCSAMDGSSKYHDCGIYIIGATDMLAYADSSVGAKVFCLPPNVRLTEVVDVAKKYLVDHPGERHLSAAELISNALKDTFPCSN